MFWKSLPETNITDRNTVVVRRDKNRKMSIGGQRFRIRQHSLQCIAVDFSKL